MNFDIEHLTVQTMISGLQLKNNICLQFLIFIFGYAQWCYQGPEPKLMLFPFSIYNSNG